MQDNNKSSGIKYIMVALVIAVAGGAYFYFKGQPSDDAISSIESSVSDVPGAADAQLAAARVQNLLNQINLINIDSSLFDSIVYKSLKDFTVIIPEQPVGRPNPFAPVPGVSATNN